MTTLVFDLDGTLVDTAPDLLAAVNATLAADGRDGVSRADLDHLVGRGGRAMLARAFAERGRELSDDKLDAMLPEFLARYRATIPGASRPYPGVVAALERFAEWGHLLAVCTNKYEGLSRSLLDALELSDRFAAICGADTFDVRKPDPGHILRTIEAAGGRADDAVMIGDSINDIEAARRAGVPSIGVPYGYTDTPMVELAPDALVPGFDEIDDALIERLVGEHRLGGVGAPARVAVAGAQGR